MFQKLFLTVKKGVIPKIYGTAAYHKLNIVGFESRRSDNPQIGRDFIKDILYKIVYEKPPEELKQDVDDFKERIQIGYYTPEELGLPIGLTKHPDKYGNQIHAKASRLANEKHKAQIKQGDKIKYIYIKGPEKVIAFKNYMWDGYEIDYDNMIRRIVDLKIGPLFESLGWDYEYTLIQKLKKIKELTYEGKLIQKELW